MSLPRFIPRIASTMKTAIRRGHGHDVPANPGPPVTMDLMPVPYQSYAKVHAELNAKFNVMLAASLSLLTISLGLAVKANIFHSECNGPPQSYLDRNRK